MHSIELNIKTLLKLGKGEKLGKSWDSICRDGVWKKSFSTRETNGLAISRRRKEGGKKRAIRGENGWTERDLGRKVARRRRDIRRSRWETRLVNDDRDSWSGVRPCYGNGGPLSCRLGAQVQTTGEQWDKLCKRGVTASSTSLLPTYVAKNEPAGTWCDFRHRFHGSSRVIDTNRAFR